MSDRIDNPSQPTRGEHCPWWCTNTQPDHAIEYDLSENGDDEILYRIHSRYYGHNDVGIIQDERNDHGVTSMLPVKLHVYTEPETGDEARKHAGWLAEAAVMLERIASGPRPAGHAPWCTDLGAFCGHGTDCYWSPDAGSESGVVLAEHQTARNAVHRIDDDPRAFVRVTMSRNLTDQFQELSRGRDRYLATLILQFGRGDDEQEINLTLDEAREVARRLTVACDLADDDAKRVKG